jgi:hypothetical protein
MDEFKTRSEQMPQMTVPPAARLFLLLVFVLCVGLDLVNFESIVVGPQGVLPFACELWPWALIKLPVLSASSVADQCSGHQQVRSIPLIFLSLKLTMSVVAFPLIWAYVALKPQWFMQAREVYEQRFASGEKYDQEFRKFAGQSLGIMAFLICLGLFAFMCVTDHPRRFSFSEIFVEDFLAVAIPAVLYSISAVALVFYYFDEERRA